MAWEDRSEHIDHATARFVWLQIAEDLAQMINSGELPAGSKLPSELELSQIYGVARNTIRRALAHLVELGLIVILHGRGTFVTRPDDSKE